MDVKRVYPVWVVRSIQRDSSAIIKLLFCNILALISFGNGTLHIKEEETNILDRGLGHGIKGTIRMLTPPQRAAVQIQTPALECVVFILVIVYFYTVCIMCCVVFVLFLSLEPF